MIKAKEKINKEVQIRNYDKFLNKCYSNMSMGEIGSRAYFWTYIFEKSSKFLGYSVCVRIQFTVRVDKIANHFEKKKKKSIRTCRKFPS